MYYSVKGGPRFLGNTANPPETRTILFRDYGFAKTLREPIGLTEDRSLRVALVLYMRGLSARLSARRLLLCSRIHRGKDFEK